MRRNKRKRKKKGQRVVSGVTYVPGARELADEHNAPASVRDELDRIRNGMATSYSDPVIQEKTMEIATRVHKNLSRRGRKFFKTKYDIQVGSVRTSSNRWIIGVSLPSDRYRDDKYFLLIEAAVKANATLVIVDDLTHIDHGEPEALISTFHNVAECAIRHRPTYDRIFYTTNPAVVLDMQAYAGMRDYMKEFTRQVPNWMYLSFKGYEHGFYSKRQYSAGIDSASKILLCLLEIKNDGLVMEEARYHISDESMWKQTSAALLMCRDEEVDERNNASITALYDRVRAWGMENKISHSDINEMIMRAVKWLSDSFGMPETGESIYIFCDMMADFLDVDPKEIHKKMIGLSNNELINYMRLLRVVADDEEALRAAGLALLEH